MSSVHFFGDVQDMRQSVAGWLVILCAVFFGIPFSTADYHVFSKYFVWPAVTAQQLADGSKSGRPIKCNRDNDPTLECYFDDTKQSCVCTKKKS